MLQGFSDRFVCPCVSCSALLPGPGHLTCLLISFPLDFPIPSALRENVQLASKLQHLAWEMCYFFSFFSYRCLLCLLQPPFVANTSVVCAQIIACDMAFCSGWLRRLIQSPSDDNATFESLRQSLLKLKPDGVEVDATEEWSNGTSGITQQLLAIGGVEFLAARREFSTTNDSSAPVVSCCRI